MSGQSDGLNNRIRAGDATALADALDRHRPRLATIIRFRLDARVARRLDPDDVLQEAYLGAARRCGHLEGDTPQSLFVWLRLIVLQTLADVHRRHLGAHMRDAGRERALARPGPDTSASLAFRLAGSLTTPTRAIRRLERAERLQAALQTMDDIDREVLALRHFEELSNQEVAAVLGIEQKAASIRYVRALRRLKNLLADLPDMDLTTA